MVYILLAPGFEEAEALVPADLLRRAGVEVALVGTAGELVPGGQGITVKADLELDQVDLSTAEMLVLPGGGVGVANLGNDPKVEALVKEAARRGIWLAAICAAPSLLAKWDLLEGRNAVCYPTWTDRLPGAVLTDAPVVVDGPFITARAAGASFDFGLKLAEVLTTAEKSQEVRHGVYYRG